MCGVGAWVVYIIGIYHRCAVYEWYVMYAMYIVCTCVVVFMCSICGV